MESAKRIVNGTTVVVFIVAFLLGYGFSTRVVNRLTPAPADTAMEDGRVGENAIGEKEIAAAAASLPEQASKGEAMMEEERPTLTVSDQPAGSVVSVGVKSGKSVWVAVHEEQDGKPGRILGAQLFPAGDRAGVVDLLRGTVEGKKYFVMAHADDGDRSFDLRKDIPITDEAGAPIARSFTATAGANR